MVKVSIVIPVYNRKNFLTVCIKSLLAQSFEDFEICLVDDGSTDGTGLLCDELAEKDTRIRVLHVQNGGATYARQKGVELATGEWVLFVDSDDTMPADALQRLFQAASEDTDIVVGFYRKKRLWGVNKLSPACYRKLLIKGRHNISATCGKLFRRTLFDEDTLRTPREIVMGEDMLMNLRLAFASSKPVRLVGGNCVYNYIQHGGNITHVFKLTADYEHIFHKERLQAILALSALEALAVSRKCGEIKRNYTLSFSHSFNAAATVSSMSAYVYCASLPPNSTLSCCCASS